MTHRESVEVIFNFMGSLAFRYKADEMRKLWRAMDTMRKRYGDVFVASAIEKDRQGAELALMRYHKDEPQEEIQASPRFHKVYPRQKNIAKRFAAMLITLAVVLMVGVTIMRSVETTTRSDEFLQEVDRFLEEERDINGIVY